MSTLNSTYLPLSSGLFSYGGGPEAKTLTRLTAAAFEPLVNQTRAQAAINDLYSLRAEADEGVSGTTTMSAETLAIGKRFLLAWPKSLPTPELLLDDDGEVVFDWAAPHRRMFSVSLRADGRLSFAGQLGARRTLHGTEEFDGVVPEPIVEGVKSIFSI